MEQWNSPARAQKESRVAARTSSQYKLSEISAVLTESYNAFRDILIVHLQDFPSCIPFGQEFV